MVRLFAVACMLLAFAFLAQGTPSDGAHTGSQSSCSESFGVTFTNG